MLSSKDRGEAYQWYGARQSSDASYACNHEVVGLPKVGRIPHGVPYTKGHLMRRIEGMELAQISQFFEAAAIVAQKATCHRAKCGTVIVKNNKIIGEGYNSPPLDDESRRTCDTAWDYSSKPKFDKTCCVHAEWRAIINACKTQGADVEGSSLYFMRVDEAANFTDAGKPFCTTCSRLAMEARITEFALWNNRCADIYPLKEYDALSYEFYRES